MSRKPVLILGGGINGAAIAREFLLNGISVCLVDQGDLSAGATAYSTRLVHGGLRYLEFGEFGLVRESLAERDRLLRLAPDYVRPLRLRIPIARRAGGWRQAAARFLGFGREGGPPTPRGRWLVGAGLWMYDCFAGKSMLPRRHLVRTGQAGFPPLHPRYRWLYAFSDAQMVYPERFVIALLEDARSIADQRGLMFAVRPYHCARRRAGIVELCSAQRSGEVAGTVEPSAIVNATGAWVDAALVELDVRGPGRLMGGTKGSHFVTYQPAIREMLASGGLYAEAPDGRPVFVLPWHDAVLVGTTDVPYHGDPADATASEEEISYLLAAVNEVLPAAGLQRDDVSLHYAGVRPLPFVDRSTPAAITRRHWVHVHAGGELPIVSVIGGKLTTCRSLAERTVAIVFKQWGRPVSATSVDRPIAGSGGGGFPAGDTAEQRDGLPRHLSFGREQIPAERELCGAGAESVPAAAGTGDAVRLPRERDPVADCRLPRRLVRHVLRREWVTRLSDLVERRLMLLYDQHLSLACLHELAQLMVEENLLSADRVAEEVETCRERLLRQFGKAVRASDRRPELQRSPENGGA